MNIVSTFKKLILFLLILIVVTITFNKTGVANLENFNNATKVNLSFKEKQKLLIHYPPLQYIVLDTLIRLFPPQKEIGLFNQQTVWVALKVTLLSFYLLTFLALKHLSKILKGKREDSILDTSLIFFGSVAIIISSLALTFFDIFAVPFFLLTLMFVFKKRLNSAALSFLLALGFNWSLLIFGPLLFLYSKNLAKNKYSQLFLSLTFLGIPILLSLLYFSNFSSKTINISNVSYGFIWQVTRPFQYILENNWQSHISFNFPFIASVMLAASAVFILSRLLIKTLLKTKKGWLFFTFSTLVLFLALLVCFVISPTLLTFTFIGILLILYLTLIYLFRKTKNTPEKLLTFSFAAYLIYLVLFPASNPGNLVWITIVAILIHLVYKTKVSFYLAILTNILAFLCLFLPYGISGYPPAKGDFFQLITYLIGFVVVIFTSWIIGFLNSNKGIPDVTSLVGKVFLANLKKFTIVLLVLTNLGLIAGDGSPDTVSWAQYSLASVQYPNPFRAQVEVDQRYPPLSTVVIGVFANAWGKIIGYRPRTALEDISHDYVLPVKASILFFYALTAFLYLKFAKGKTLNKLFIILTTFSLIIQTQGLADLNIYVFPTLVGAIYALFKKKYYLSGILLGATISIKWQPVILVPLFFLSLVNFQENIKKQLPNMILFILGFIPIPVIGWLLVLVQPGGLDAFNRAFSFLKEGAPMLSGQALNLNWIVTYFMHILKPDLVGSLADLDYLNRQIPTAIAPKIFQGYPFFLVAAVIFLIYFFLRNKNIINFLGASLMIFFSHHILNKSAYEKHLFYTVALMLLIYLIKPTRVNRYLLILFDIMTIMNLVFFYGYTGSKDLGRLIFGFDVTVLFSFYYLIIFLIVLWNYSKARILSEN